MKECPLHGKTYLSVAVRNDIVVVHCNGDHCEFQDMWVDRRKRNKQVEHDRRVQMYL